MRLTGWMGLLALVLVFGPVAAGEKIIGTWSYVSGEKDGKKIAAKDLAGGSVGITKDKITLTSPDGKFVISYKLDTSKKPAQISMEILEGPQGKGAKSVGIIGMKGENLVICYPAMGGDTPKTFATKEGSGLNLFTLKKKKSN